MGDLARDGKHHVTIVNDHGQNAVHPPWLTAATGDPIEFHSLGAGTVRLIFPTAVLADVNGTPVDSLVITPDQPDGGVVRPVRPGAYTYMAYCEAADDLALGRSQPKIIIYK